MFSCCYKRKKRLSLPPSEPVPTYLQHENETVADFVFRFSAEMRKESATRVKEGWSPMTDAEEVSRFYMSVDISLVPAKLFSCTSMMEVQRFLNI